MNKTKTQLIAVALLCLVIPAILTMLSPREDKPDTVNTSQSIRQTVETASVNASKLRVLIDGALTEMNMEDYLVAVLLKEMPGDFEEEALKAQAVVARTYALRRNLKADKHSQGAVCADASCCQGFCTPEDYIDGGGDAEVVSKMTKAVSDTEGLVLTYAGELIEATYFSCSGGKTEDAQAVWGADVPYLQAVDSPGEETASHYTDTLKYTAKEFQELLGDELLGQPGCWVKSITYTDGGGVDTIKIGNVTYTGTKIRSLLRLPSTAFVISAVGEHVIITTKGFGHRVGLSQYGADAMAVQGCGFEEILNHYYSGTALADWKDIA